MHTGSTLARVGGTVGWPPVQYSDCWTRRAITDRLHVRAPKAGPW